MSEISFAITTFYAGGRITSGFSLDIISPPTSIPIVEKYSLAIPGILENLC